MDANVKTQKGRPRKKFTTEEALELYQQGYSYRAIAKILSDRHGEKILHSAVQQRFLSDQVDLNRVQDDPVSGSERTRKWRERLRAETRGGDRSLGRPVKEFDVNAAYDDYLKSGLEDVALKYKVSYSTLSLRFKSSGLEVRKRGRPLEGNEALPPNIRQQKYCRRKKQNNDKNPDNAVK